MHKCFGILSLYFTSEPPISFVLLQIFGCAGHRADARIVESQISEFGHDSEVFLSSAMPDAWAGEFSHSSPTLLFPHPSTLPSMYRLPSTLPSRLPSRLPSTMFNSKHLFGGCFFSQGILTTIGKRHHHGLHPGCNTSDFWQTFDSGCGEFCCISSDFWQTFDSGCGEFCCERGCCEKAFMPVRSSQAWLEPQKCLTWR